MSKIGSGNAPWKIPERKRTSFFIFKDVVEFAETVYDSACSKRVANKKVEKWLKINVCYTCERRIQGIFPIIRKWLKTA